MKAIREVSDIVLQKIVAVVQKKCGLIGRSYLSDVTTSDIASVHETNTPSCYVVNIRGMNYSVNTDMDRFGIYDPVLLSSSARGKAGSNRGYLAAD